MKDFDFAVLSRSTDNDLELAAELCSIFLGQVTEMFEKIRTATESGDVYAVARSAHALKGSAACIGAERIRALSAELELTSTNESVEGLERKAKELSQAIDDLRPILAAYLRQNDSVC